MDLVHVAKSWEMLHDPKIAGQMNSEEYRKLCLAAGYSVTMADKAAADWALKRLRKDLPV